MKRVSHPLLVATAALSVLLFTASGCRPAAVATEEQAHERENPDEMPPLSAVTLNEGERLQVVATTNIVADVVQNVGGDLIDLKTLMPVGTDPHTFEPTPQDVAAVADAHVVFVNGAGLEIFLEHLMESAGEGVTVVPVSYGLELRQFEHAQKQEGDHHHGEFDPHTWFDPTNVMVWTHNIEHTLSTLDPGNAEAYEANAEAYEAELEELDGWIRERLASIPEANRRLVTDHTSFSYFAHRYGFEQVGAVFPGYSTLAEPSAQDIAALEDTISEFDVKAIFVGLTVNPDLAKRVAEDTGTQLVFLYTGSLSEAGDPADDYISFMKYNVSAIAEALR
jgi:manganese/iron transport system substrate-binding protein